MEAFGNRYSLKEAWKNTPLGSMARAADEKLKRDVLLYRLKVESELQRRETVRRLSQAARFSDRGFLHVLDVGVEGEELYAVLTAESGGLLSERLQELQWNGKETLEKLGELVAAIREARKERLNDFASTADNLWLDGEGKLRFINSWTEAKGEQRDVRGLAVLLYQLGSRRVESPPSLTEYSMVLRASLKDLPGGDTEAAVAWACQAFHTSSTLREFENGLNRLLGKEGKPRDSLQPPGGNVRLQPQRPSVHLPAEKPGRSWAYEPAPAAASIRWSRILPWLLVASFALGVGAIWYWSYERFEASIITSAVQASATPTPVREPSPSPKQGTKPAPSGSAAAAVKTSPTPSPSASSASSVSPAASPSADLPSQPAPEAGVVPDLTGKTREEAEKLALKAGLRYSFTLEVNEAVKGTVIRQDLPAGAPVKKGDKITFAVSKGK